MGWLEKSPFNLYQLKFNRQERDFLTAEELDKLEKFEFSNPRLTLVRDLFVFSCYTGLAYCDVIALTPEQIGIDILKRYWIYTNRTKTEIRVDIPLLSAATDIYEEYRSNPQAIQQGKVFPWVSNQEVNRILKIIAEIVGNAKEVTFLIKDQPVKLTIQARPFEGRIEFRDKNNRPVDVNQLISPSLPVTTAKLLNGASQKKVIKMSDDSTRSRRL